MSSNLRASSVSSPSSVSSRLRSRISGCERAGSAQTLGSEILVSMSASSRLSRGASKILPQLAHPVANRGVAILQFIQHGDSLRYGGLAPLHCGNAGNFGQL